METEILNFEILNFWIYLWIDVSFKNMEGDNIRWKIYLNDNDILDNIEDREEEA